MKPTIVLLFSSLAVALAAPPKAELMQVHKVYLLPMTNGMEQYLANRLTGLGVFQVVTDPMKADAIFTDGIGEVFESRLTDWFPQKPAKQASDEAAPAAAPEVGPVAQPLVAANPPASATPQAAAPATPQAAAAATPQTAAALPLPQTGAPASPQTAAALPLPQAAATPAPPPPPQLKVVASEPEKQDQTAGGELGGDRAVPVTAFHRAKGTLFLVDPRSRLVIWSIYAQPKDASSAELDRTAAYIATRIRQDLKSH